MLVLGLKENERVFIELPTSIEELTKLAGQTVEMQVIKTGKKIKVGFDGDTSIAIDREVVYNSKKGLETST